MTSEHTATAPAPSRWPRLFEWASFGSFLLSLMLGLLLPIYTDEVGWRMQLRAGLDGGVDRMLSDICGPTSTAVPPWFMMPWRHFSAWLNLTFPDPLYVRISGLVCAIAWAFLLRALIGRIAVDERQRTLLRTLAFGLLGMGILPLMLVMSRPDQAILLTMTGALLVAVIAARRSAGGDRWFLLWPFLIAALGAAAISYHLKGILIAPLILVCIFFAGSGKRTLTPRLLAILLFTAVAAQGAHYWVERFRCPDDPVLAEMLAKQNIASELAGPGGWRNVGMAAISGVNPDNYIMLAEARRYPMSDWLPRGQIDGVTALRRFLAMGLAWNGAALIALLCLMRALWLRWRERRIDMMVAVPVVLAGLGMVWGISQRIRNDYEIMTALPMLALFCIYSLASVPWTTRRTRQLGIAASLVVLLSIAGQADIAWRFSPSLRAAATQPGCIDTQPLSASIYGYGALRGEIRATARLCGIGSNGQAKHPLVDDVTYFAMTDSWQPFHRLAVLGKWKGSISNPIAYLKSRGSEGMILGCRYLSPELLQQATRSGEFCCISTR